MKDVKWILLFVAIGLALAYAVSGPLRRPPVREFGVYAQGTVSVSPDLAARIKDFSVLFLIARPLAGGMPLAVKRVENPVFPYNFVLSLRDSMTGGEFYDGDIWVVARLDKDGVAGPKQEGDEETSLEIGKNATHVVSLRIGAPI